MNTQTRIETHSNRPMAAARWAHVIFILCEDQVFAAVELKDEIGPVWVEMFETFRDAFDYGVQRGFISANYLTLSRQAILTPEKPVLTSSWVPFNKKLVVGLIPGHVVNEH